MVAVIITDAQVCRAPRSPTPWTAMGARGSPSRCLILEDLQTTLAFEMTKITALRYHCCVLLFVVCCLLFQANKAALHYLRSFKTVAMSGDAAGLVWSRLLCLVYVLSLHLYAGGVSLGLFHFWCDG